MILSVVIKQFCKPLPRAYTNTYLYIPKNICMSMIASPLLYFTATYGPHLRTLLTSDTACLFNILTKRSSCTFREAEVMKEESEWLQNLLLR